MRKFRIFHDLTRVLLHGCAHILHQMLKARVRRLVPFLKLCLAASAFLCVCLFSFPCGGLPLLVLPCSLASPLGRLSRFGELHKRATVFCIMSRAASPNYFFERETGADRLLNMCQTVFLPVTILFWHEPCWLRIKSLLFGVFFFRYGHVWEG